MSLFDVGSNKIQEIENLENIWYVKDLCFAKNKIKEIKNLDIFVNLESLALSVMNKFYSRIKKCNNIQANQISRIGNGLSKLKKLRELQLAENNITEIEGLDQLVWLIFIHNIWTDFKGKFSCIRLFI